MNFESLIGCRFQENELFELFQFDVEENFDDYLTSKMHVFFERESFGAIKVVEVVNHENVEQLHETNKKSADKREFFYIYFNYGHVDIGLCRLDRSNPCTVVRRDSTLKQDWGYMAYADEFPRVEMTREEIRLAFAELAGCLEEYKAQLALKDKKSA